MIVTTRIEAKSFFELTSRQCALLAANWNIVEVFLTKIDPLFKNMLYQFTYNVRTSELTSNILPFPLLPFALLLTRFNLHIHKPYNILLSFSL